MKNLMDGIVSALKKINYEKSQISDVYKDFNLSLGELDDYCKAEVFNSR